MQDNPIPGRTNDARDTSAEAAVMDQVLWLHPANVTEDELLLSLFAGEAGPRREELERAILELLAAGLLRIDGGSIVPTLAALRFEEISV